MRDYQTLLLNSPVDVSKEFVKQENCYFNCTKVVNFDSSSKSGTLEWKRFSRKARMAFNQVTIDYQTHKVFEGEKWVDIENGDIPVILLIRDGSVIPYIQPAQSTDSMDWDRIEFDTYYIESDYVKGYIFYPGSDVIILGTGTNFRTCRKFAPCQYLQSFQTYGALQMAHGQYC